MSTVPVDAGYVSVSMRAAETQLFLSAIGPGPIKGDDGLELRVGGRGQDLGPDDQEWRFEASAYPPGEHSGLELFITVGIPESDVPEVVNRLRGQRTVD